MNDIINLDEARANRNRPKIQILKSVCQAGGSHPFLAAATDGHEYWCKVINNPQGREVLINEVVAAIIGERIQAPVPKWAILDVPAELKGYFVKNAGYRLTGEPVFGSRVIHTSDIYCLDDTGVLQHVSDDSNYKRIPKLYAHWLLCNAEDIQIMYNYDNDYSINSIDHGFWFGSNALPWQFGSHTSLSGRPELPAIRKEIPKDQWDDAIAKLDNLDETLLADFKSLIPESWGTNDKELKTIVTYVLGRKEYTKSTLRDLQRRTQRR